MRLADVMQTLADRLAAIDGLHSYGYPPDTVVPPAAIVSYPESYELGGTYRRGADTMIIPIVVVVGRVSDRASRDAISAYLSGSGSRSIIATLTSGEYDACDTVFVQSAEFDTVTIGGTEYLAATVDVHITGKGDT